MNVIQFLLNAHIYGFEVKSRCEITLCWFFIAINYEYDGDGTKDDNLKFFLIKIRQYKEFGECNHREFKWYNENEICSNLLKTIDNFNW